MTAKRAASSPLLRITEALDRINGLLGPVVSWLALAMVLVTFLVVVLRYVFDVGSIALQESVTYMHATLFMLGAAYTLRHDAHVRVDVFYRSASERHRALVNAVGTLLFLLPVCAYLLYEGVPYALASWRIGEGSREAGGLPALYLLKSLIPLTATLLGLQGLALLARSLLVLRGSRRGGR